jgi:hypothetical protein
MTILPCIVAETVLSHREHSLTPDQESWFVQHVEDRANHLHPKYHFDSNKGRERLYAFVGHWLDCYLLNPESFQNKFDKFDKKD